jgi:hypothetical protein
MKELSLLVLAKRKGKGVEKHSQRKKEKEEENRTKEHKRRYDPRINHKELPRILRNLYHAGAAMEESESNS